MSGRVGFDWFAAAGEGSQPGPADGRGSSSHSVRDRSHGTVRGVIGQLIRPGYARHTVIGATLNKQYIGNGAQIAREAGNDPAVAPGGPAARAGLRPGDVIVGLGSLPVTSAYALVDAIRSLSPGSRVAVTYVRHGEARRAELTLGSARS